MKEGGFTEIEDQYGQHIQEQKLAYQKGCVSFFAFFFTICCWLCMTVASVNVCSTGSLAFFIALRWSKVMNYLLEMDKPLTHHKDAKVRLLDLILFGTLACFH